MSCVLCGLTLVKYISIPGIPGRAPGFLNFLGRQGTGRDVVDAIPCRGFDACGLAC